MIRPVFKKKCTEKKIWLLLQAGLELGALVLYYIDEPSGSMVSKVTSSPWSQGFNLSFPELFFRNALEAQVVLELGAFLF